ncbi:hypothetical protein, partial [Klebsiella pneumoniae]|uniref:hypothetical protein n=1 Tax=Klebsiella pneumoniae TaxID=573 RepID=UPI0013D46BF1
LGLLAARAAATARCRFLARRALFSRGFEKLAFDGMAIAIAIGAAVAVLTLAAGLTLLALAARRLVGTLLLL